MVRVKNSYGFIGALVCNTLLLVAAYLLCRLAFFAENYALFRDIDAAEAWSILRGGLRFDIAAIAYSNALYLALFFFPLHSKERHGWQLFLRIIYVVVNTICLSANLADAVYYPFIKRRTTASIFTEFQNDNLGSIIGWELINHWYLTLLAIALTVTLWLFYRTPRPQVNPRWRYYVQMVAGLCISSAFLVCAMRGGFDPELRPLHSGHAREYVQKPSHAVLVMNTPFSIFRTSSKQSFPEVNYFDEQLLEQVYTPLHTLPPSNSTRHHDNVVILLLESFSSEYSRLLNPHIKDEGYMPFLDSLMSEGLTYGLSFANGLSSIDAQASVFASIPMMVESFMSSHATLNDLDGIGNYVKPMGYKTAFFHGADNGSLSIDGFVKACGLDAYYGRNEFNNDDEWDRHWGIWDEPFMQFMVQTLNHTPEPFCAGLFTVTSHHPFQIPPQYRDTFPEGQLPIYKTIRYTDHSLRRFFEAASRQPWYDHTLFVITGDHTNIQAYPEYMTDLGRFQVPLVFYHPTDTLFKGKRPGIAQHTDIMPTVLHHIGFSGSYIAFGNDLLTEDSEQQRGFVSYINGVFQYMENDYLLQFDGQQSIALYALPTDPLLQANVVGAPNEAARVHAMETKLKSIIQQYMSRMNRNRLTVSHRTTQ